jgi:hypothetical protein
MRQAMVRIARGAVHGVKVALHFLGRAVDFGGDLSERVWRKLLDNPALAIAVTTVLLYAVARIPTEIFYSEFGVRPEDVGLNSVQVLLQGSAVSLGLFLFGGVAYSMIIMALMVLLGVFYAFLLGRKGAVGTAWGAIRRVLRLSPILVPSASIAVATIFLCISAERDASRVWFGEPLAPRFFPWSAEAVEARWSGTRTGPKLPGCHSLLYLGEGNDRVVLFNALDKQTLRVPTAEIRLRFPLYC